MLKPLLPLIVAFWMFSDDPRKAKTPPGWAALPLPVMVLADEKPKDVSPSTIEPPRMLMPAPALPEIVLPPMISASRFCPVSLPPLRQWLALSEAIAF